MTAILSDVALAALLALGACSAGLEAHRTTPVSLSKFEVGEDRLDSVSVLGAPEGQVTADTGPFDVYGLFATGVGGFGKGLIVGRQALANVAKPSLAGIVLTPAQAGTQPSKLVSVSNKKREG